MDVERNVAMREYHLHRKEMCVMTQQDDIKREQG